MIEAASSETAVTNTANRQETGALLAVRGLSKRFSEGKASSKRSVEALVDVSFDVQAGECLGLVGESGSGKTTLARIVSGLLPADEGTIRFEGIELTPKVFAGDRRLRQQIQIVFQNPFQALNPRRTIFHSVALPLRNFHRLDGATARGRVGDLLEQVELKGDVLDRYPSELSGGQCQRVALARALAADPQLLVLDEAVASVDALTAVKLMDLLRALRSRGRLEFLFISHDLGLVASFADQIAVLERGRLVEMGSTLDVHRAPRHPYTRRLLEASEAVVLPPKEVMAGDGKPLDNDLNTREVLDDGQS
jgi:peptide/nickel transport system ATP-binding protein